jgi:phospholipid N-methyltransferase
MSQTNGHHNGNGHSRELKAPVGQYLVPGQRLSPEALAEYYNQNVREARGNYDANDWADPEQMYSQFDFVTRMVDLNGKELLDVGSGNGLFFEYLDKKGIKPASITAIDIAGEQIKQLHSTFPKVTAITGDFFKHEYEQSYDVITLLGVAPCLKFIFPTKDRISALFRLLDRAVRYANYGVAFSFLNRNCYETCEQENYEYVYYYPEEICSLLSGARFEISTVENDLVTNCFLYCHDRDGLPFRFNMNRIDEVFGLLK